MDGIEEVIAETISQLRREGLQDAEDYAARILTALDNAGYEVVIRPRLQSFVQKKPRLIEMTLDHAIANSIRRYPSLYRNRTDVLHQFFCVNGNGMEWVDGRLVDFYDDGDREADDRLKGSVEDGALGIRFRVEHDLDRMIEQFRRDRADDLAQIASSVYDNSYFSAKPVYPLCQYACMNEVPDDVKPDWLAGVREMIFAVFAAPPRQPNHRFSAQQAKDEVASNIAFASGVLTRLAERFGNPDNQPTDYEKWRQRQIDAQEHLRSILKIRE